MPQTRRQIEIELEALKGLDSRERREAAEAVSLVCSLPNEEQFMALREPSSFYPLQEICYILTAIGPAAQEATPFLLALLEREGDLPYAEAIEALGSIGSPLAFPHLLPQQQALFDLFSRVDWLSPGLSPPAQTYSKERI
jgi:HEAT repeat protein